MPDHRVSPDSPGRLPDGGQQSAPNPRALPDAPRIPDPRALPDIDVATIPTKRVRTCVRFIDGREGSEPVVLLHGNLSSSPFFFPLMQHLPRRFRPIALDLRGFGGTDPAPVDATRGLRDFSDDVLATMDALDLESAHLIGWSLGGGVAMQAVVDAPARCRSLTLLAPISPYGFGATIDDVGTLAAPDGAGSGAGMVSTRFVRALAAGDTSDQRGSPRALLRRAWMAPGWSGEHEEMLVAAMLSTVVDDDHYPGDTRPSESWPGFAPGTRGVMNAMAPVYLNLAKLVDVSPKPRILWLHGDDDRVVSDSSAMDSRRHRGSGSLPGGSPVESAPPQPMVTQTRAVLDAYRGAGGRYREVVVPDTGHVPHIEDLPRTLEAVVPHLDGADDGD